VPAEYPQLGRSAHRHDFVAAPYAFRVFHRRGSAERAGRHVGQIRV